MKNIIFFIIIFIVLFGIAFTTNAGEKIKDIIIGTLTADVLKVKKQIEVGGKIYLNGVISNKTKGRGGKDNPVIFSDDVRIDGRVYRSSPAGDSNPFIINDDVEIKGNLTVAGNASYIPAMTCANGEVLKYGSNGWICGRDNDLFTANCFNADEILKWDGSKWVCMQNTDKDINVKLESLANFIVCIHNWSLGSIETGNITRKMWDDCSNTFFHFDATSGQHAPNFVPELIDWPASFPYIKNKY